MGLQTSFTHSSRFIDPVEKRASSWSLRADMKPETAVVALSKHEVGLREPRDLCARVSKERGDGEGAGSQALCACG